MVAAFAIAPATDTSSLSRTTVVEQLSLPRAATLGGDNGLFLREEAVQPSDTLAGLLARLGIADIEALEFVRQDPATRMLSRQLRPGKLVTATTDQDGVLKSLYFPVNGKDAVLTVERRDGRLSAREEALRPEIRTTVRSGEIETSLFGATDAAGIPDSVAGQLAEIFSGEIDFHRDLRKGDQFTIVYETLYHRGLPMRSGRILSAKFVNGGRPLRAVWFESTDHIGGYYSADGKSLRKAFLRSPLEFSRVTSGFSGSRFHPVLQEWRAHRGVDYGAPIGTRVRSTGDGIIEFIGRQNGYGNLIVVRHAGQYSTAYGHLNGFAAGLRRGARVGQGEVIGYVGRTGLATGPHLHYEFRVNDQQVNPLAIALPAAKPLDPTQLERFRNVAGGLLTQLQLGQRLNLSSLD